MTEHAGKHAVARAAALLCVVWLAVPAIARAEFYRWTDANGGARVSNVPPAGVRTDGSVERAYHPWSVAGQHARMRERLARQSEIIEAQQAAAAKAAAADGLLPFSFDFSDAPQALD